MVNDNPYFGNYSQTAVWGEVLNFPAHLFKTFEISSNSKFKKKVKWYQVSISQDKELWRFVTQRCEHTSPYWTVYLEMINGAPGWLSRLSVWLLISAQILISVLQGVEPTLKKV